MMEHSAASSKKTNLPQLLNIVQVQNTHQERAGARILMAGFRSSGAVVMLCSSTSYEESLLVQNMNVLYYKFLPNYYNQSIHKL